MLQTTVRRAYTGGFAGQIVADGPRRAKPGRILSANIGAGVNKSTNRMSRAFGFSSDYISSPTDPELGVGNVAQVVLGGTTFFGILGEPQSYALYGALVGGTLDASMDLRLGDLGEFFDMVTGMCVELFNETTAVKPVGYGDGVAYITGEDPNGVPIGGLIAVAAGGTAPAGSILIPNARIMTAQSLAASAAGVATSKLAVVQLTQ